MDTIARRILATVLLLGTLVGAACSQAAPSPTATSSKPAPTTAPAAKPAASASPATGPAATASAAAKPAATASAKPAASTDWKAEWDKILAAAKQEGKVTVAGGPGDAFRSAHTAFHQAYPDIQIEYTGISGADFTARVLAERDAGQYLWDLRIGGASSMMTTLRPKGVLDPLAPTVVLPDNLDDSKWQGGYSEGWIESEPHKNMYSYEGHVQFAAIVNRDVVPESELNSLDQLLDPKWKGKIVVQDPRKAGASQAGVAFFVVTKGDDWTRKLLAQDVVVTNETRQVVESLVRGTTPIAFGLDWPELAPFQKQGLAGNVKPLDPDNKDGGFSVGGFGTLALINKAPHPNAARVFINWQLSQEGQQAWVQATQSNSRRLDVPGPTETAFKPNVNYVNSYKEGFEVYRTKGGDMSKEILK